MKKGFDAILFVHDITSKMFSVDSNCIVDLVIWPTFDNSSTFVRQATQFYKDLTKRTTCFEERLQLGIGMALKFNGSVPKGLKLKVRKILRSISMFAEVTAENLVEDFFGDPMLNRLANVNSALREIL